MIADSSCCAQLACPPMAVQTSIYAQCFDLKAADSMYGSNRLMDS